ncbi:hypothetical protein AB6A40_001515 [Gnathostoma spinigerum]|uniref:Uncharacterized protein n=1 Tax=Gnathostoma spinigerum TaxID=75299 RepID=A0ABD6E6M4_9BILA
MRLFFWAYFAVFLLHHSIHACTFAVRNHGRIRNRRHQKQAFDLIRLEASLYKHINRSNSKYAKSNEEHIYPTAAVNDFPVADEDCEGICNQRLRTGLDMVKAHLAFGSIGVPPIKDKTDFNLFCKLDADHDNCLRSCGFSIKFNMRNFVCKQHVTEMTLLLPCYGKASHDLLRRCGVNECGPYNSLEASFAGYAQRCRTLICDLVCTSKILCEQCGEQQGAIAAAFLLRFTKEQVYQWMKESAVDMQKSMYEVMPASCKRIIYEANSLIECK